MHLFDGPSVLDELYRQIVQQFGMARPIAGSSEIAQGADEPRAKMMVPDTVHHDSGSQWIRGIRNLIGEIQAAAPGFQWRGLGIGEHGKKMAWNRFAKIVGIA